MNRISIAAKNRWTIPEYSSCSRFGYLQKMSCGLLLFYRETLSNATIDVSQLAEIACSKGRDPGTASLSLQNKDSVIM
jgi:hypothetical protein